MNSGNGQTSNQLDIINTHPGGTPARGALAPGQVRARPAVNKSQAHAGVAPLTPFSHGTQKFETLPEPIGQPPYHYELSAALPQIEADVATAGKLVLHVAGDTGGIKSPEFQASVAAAMKGDLNKPVKEVPRFFYHLGDVVYYNGQIEDYYGQFYEPYEHYGAPILGIPGNHDGDPIGPPQTSLDGWTRYFMTPDTRINPESHDAPRATMSLPNPYFTLNCPLATIVGVYSNVPEGGSIDSVQQQWLTNELATAPRDKALIVAIHHPIYSFDDHHSGSARMADVLQHAINDSRRVPNMVLTAHVHNYQRIERELVVGKQTPFLVVGNGGYYHLHGMNIDPPAPVATPPAHAKPAHGTAPPLAHDTQTGAKLIFSNHTNHGYCTLTIDKESISGSVTLVEDGKYPAISAADTFHYPAAALFLAENATVSL